VSTLAEAGYDPDFGARPVKRAIQRDVLNALSKQLLAGAVSKDKDITIDSKDGEIVFRN
jgi:ATP-dependent Clp protease ATP-binding subunit ClpB